jgi:hypothetical protein
VETWFKNIFNKQKAIHIRKFSLLYNQQNKVLSTSALDSKKFILNLSKYVLVLTDSEEAKPHSSLDMACAVESVVSELSWNSGGRSGPC